MSSQKPAVRNGHRIAVRFEPGRGLATEVIELPSNTQARRYVRENGLKVVRGEFKVAPNCSIRHTSCETQQSGPAADAEGGQ